MAAVNITNTVTDPSGTAVVGATITARLQPCGGFRADFSEVAPVESTTTNGSGAWTLSLERNDQITPSGTYYEVTESLGSSHGDRVWAIYVDGASTLMDSLATSQLSVGSIASIPLPGASATAIAIGDAVAGGSAGTYSRSDHLHGLVGGTSTASVIFGGAISHGVATTPARSDHIHTLRNPAFLRTGVSMSIPNTTTTDIDLDANGTTELNTGTFTLLNGDLTCPETGLYVTAVSGEWAGNVTGVRSLQINRTAGSERVAVDTSTGAVRSVYTAIGVDLVTAGQSFKYQATQTSGGALTLSDVRVYAVCIAKVFT